MNIMINIDYILFVNQRMSEIMKAKQRLLLKSSSIMEAEEEEL